MTGEERELENLKSDLRMLRRDHDELRDDYDKHEAWAADKIGALREFRVWQIGIAVGVGAVVGLGAQVIAVLQNGGVLGR